MTNAESRTRQARGPCAPHTGRLGGGQTQATEYRCPCHPAEPADRPLDRVKLLMELVDGKLVGMVTRANILRFLDLDDTKK